ncbi:MAG: hypothetical protein R2751_09375 [Bacteroidales bacterium]
MARGNGLFAMDDNGTIDDISDDVYERYTVIDENGNDHQRHPLYGRGPAATSWLGTNQAWSSTVHGACSGKGRFMPSPPRPGRRYDRCGCSARDMAVTAIEVDGGNRKWLGTEGGGFFWSRDGQEILHQLTSTNSPLLSDNITSVCVDGVSESEVFFGTEVGIVSYMGDASEGSSSTIR